MPSYIHLLLLIGSVLHKAKCYLKIKFYFISLSHPICSDKRMFLIMYAILCFLHFPKYFFLSWNAQHCKDGGLKSKNKWGPPCY